MTVNFFNQTMPPGKTSILEILTEAGFIYPLRKNAYQIVIPFGKYKEGNILFLDASVFL